MLFVIKMLITEILPSIIAIIEIYHLLHQEWCSSHELSNFCSLCWTNYCCETTNEDLSKLTTVTAWVIHSVAYTIQLIFQILFTSHDNRASGLLEGVANKAFLWVLLFLSWTSGKSIATSFLNDWTCFFGIKSTSNCKKFQMYPDDLVTYQTLFLKNK